MGLLDDAIREHLELKRRRGADPAEIERLEREALGPTRRGPEPSGLHEELLDDRPATTYAEPDLGSHSDSAWEGAEEEGSHASWEEWEHDAPPAAEPGAPEPAAAGHDETALPPAPAEAVSPVPEPVAPPPASPPPAPVPAPEPEAAGGETIEYDVEAEHGAEEREGEDVLEETPEFLQDTPDHDRLWFEQRPPRDFDFDG